GVRTSRFTCGIVIGMTMPHRCLWHITRLCSPPQGLVNRVMRAARAHAQAGLGSPVTDAEVDVLTRWYRTGVIYSVEVGLFPDGNDAAPGDFHGLAGRLD